jgi:hypothetical protein
MVGWGFYKSYKVMKAKMGNANPNLRLQPHRVLTLEEKLNIAQALYETAKVVKIGMLRRSHPDWTEAQLLKEARRMLFLMHD